LHFSVEQEFFLKKVPDFLSVIPPPMPLLLAVDQEFCHIEPMTSKVQSAAD